LSEDGLHDELKNHKRIGLASLAKIQPTGNWFTYGIVYRAGETKTSVIFQKMNDFFLMDT
jgi:hypothetical protein